MPGAARAMVPGAARAMEPLDREAFAALMARFEPFGQAPSLAVAVSGGADSLALTFLLDDWIGARNGRLVALTVDHGLRAESKREARWVAARLRGRGPEHRILTWRPEARPEANIQAAARAARIALLTAWCVRHHVPFLALAQHRDDQAETLLLRLGRGSGLDGLAAMPARAESAGVALLRPLLSVPKARLEATLRARGQDWIEDPSNRNRRHGRARLRALLPDLATEGLTPERLAATAARLGRARAALEDRVTARLAEAVFLHPAGFARADAARLLAGPEEVALRALGRLVQCVGGQAHTPRLDRLERLLARLRDESASATLGGCGLLRRGGGAPGLLVVREAGRIAPEPLGGRKALHWDGRFELAFKHEFVSRDMILTGLAGAGARPEGLRDLVRAAAFPPAARGALPALMDRRGLAAVPHLGFWRDRRARNAVKHCRFAPKNSLSSTGFTVA